MAERRRAAALRTSVGCQTHGRDTPIRGRSSTSFGSERCTEDAKALPAVLRCRSGGLRKAQTGSRS
jgi:hypothetical protein